MNATTNKKYFTVAEANRMLPLVRAIVGDIVELYSTVSDRRERLKSIREAPGASNRDEESLYAEEVNQIEADLEKDVARLQEYVDELHELGVELKDPLSGLIDFRTLIDDEREAYLCWQLGEEEVAYWHELDAGFAGRQSLLQNSLSGEDDAADGQSSER